MTSSQFHFTSDYLEENVKDATYDITDWGDGFDILLYNYEKENLAQVSADPIEYQIEVSGTNSDWVCDTTTSTDNSLELVQGKTNTWSGKLETKSDGTPASQAIHLKANQAALNSDVTVTVTSTKPYKKTLQAKFTVVSKKSPDFTLQNNTDGSCVLTIQSNDYGDSEDPAKNTITLKWGTAAYEPDRTNSLMSEWQENAGNPVQLQTIQVSPHTTYSLTFLYQGDGNPTLDLGQGNSGLTGSGTTITLQ